MGLFSKLASKMDGGVQVRVQAPSSVPSNQVIPVTVNVTSQSAQTITGVKVEIKAQEREQGFSVGMGNNLGNRPGFQNEQTMAQTVAQAESRDGFTVGPGETKTVNLQLFLNGGAVTGNPFGQLGNMGAIGGVLQTVANVATNMNHVNYIYTVHASVGVQGHTLNPSDKLPIQILPPEEGAQPGQPTTPNVAPPAVSK